MGHKRITLASDEEHELTLERCDCGQYSLSMGPVTVQLEESTVDALGRLLGHAKGRPAAAHPPGFSMPLPPDVQ